MSDFSAEQRLFFARASQADWPKERIEAWLYCNSVHGTPFPDDHWSSDEMAEVSDSTLRVYRARKEIYALENERNRMVEQQRHERRHALAESAVAIGVSALLTLFTGRR